MVCAVKWCVALPRTDAKYCAIHAARPNFAPPASAAPNVACVECEDSGECVECEGSGEHECDNWKCGHVHDCGACDGSGECECVRDHGALTKHDRDYLEWAQGEPLQALVAIALDENGFRKTVREGR